jgi:hypothetical protein
MKSIIMYLLIGLTFVTSCVQSPPQRGQANRNLSSTNSINSLRNSTIETKLFEQLNEYLSAFNVQKIMAGSKTKIKNIISNISYFWGGKIKT